jgi:RNA-directed DNA polymerase
MSRTRGGRRHANPSSRGIAEQAKKDKGRRFTNLAKQLTYEFLMENFRLLNKKAATGIDGVTHREYAKDLRKNIMNLLERVSTGKYRARFVRRKYIKKQNGKLRPLGIPTIEDKLLQAAVARILGAIYEEDFTDASYGYRTGRGPKDAIRQLTDQLRGKYSYVVEADIKGFFDHLNHEWLMKMLELRIGDGTIKRLIRKWLKAGVVAEDGIIFKPVEGTPQGGVISPILANIYLHYVLDLWFEREIKKNCDGEAYLIRFADDFVALFRYARDAEMFYHKLRERLTKFCLELAEEKTRIVSFSRFRKYEKTSFTFLGIEFRWGISNNGKDVIKRRTARKRLQKAFAEITEWCRENRHQRIRKQTETMKLKLQGHYNYYGIAGNSEGIRQFFDGTMRIWYRWLNRRSQHRSYTWKGFKEMTKQYGIPKPRIVEQWWIKPSVQYCLELT